MQIRHRQVSLTVLVGLLLSALARIALAQASTWYNNEVEFCGVANGAR